MKTKKKISPKPKKQAKLAATNKEVYEYYKDLLKQGKGASAIAATAAHFRVNQDMTWIAIKEHQDIELARLEKANGKEKDLVKKKTQEQIINATRLKSSDELALHKAGTQIRVNKFASFAHTNLNQLDLKRQVFRAYLEINMGYDKPDANLLVKIFNNEINEGNIKYFITRTAKEIYIGIINEMTPMLANFKPYKQIIKTEE